MTEPTQRDDDPSAALVSVLAASGFPRMPSAVLMAIMTSEEGALTAEQLAERLSASAGAISGAVQYLERVGMIQRHRRAGSRRFEYELPLHPWYTVSVSKTEAYTVMADLADQAAARVGPRAAERLVEMADFFRFVRSRLPELLSEWNAQRTTLGEAPIRGPRPN